MSGMVRLYHYLLTMFPPATLVPMGVAKFLSIYLALQALGDMSPLRLGWRAGVGAVSTVLWMLLVRLQDDIKDADLDIRLGRAGDPRYKDRPIVRGEITVLDLRRMCCGGSGLLFGLNASFGFSTMLIACVMGFVITWLGFQWFFIPALVRNPSPLAYLARKSLTILLGVYTVAVFLDACQPASVSPWAILLLLAPCVEVAAWETARKVRIPEDETEYGTYSKVLGWRRAALLPAVFLAVALVCLGSVAGAIGLGWEFPAVLSVTAAVAIGACLRFRFAPTREHANLQPYAELFGVVAHGGLIVALGFQYGVTFI